MLIPENLFTILAIVIPLVELVGIAAAVHAIMNAKTSQAAIAWGISLVTFPWMALVLYAVFGRNKFNGYILLRQSRDSEIHSILEKCQKELVQNDLIDENLSGPETVFTQLGQLPILRRNKSELLIDGEKTFRCIFDGIDSAEDYILVLFYIIKDDNLGRQFKNKLIQKAKENARVYFLYDEIGSYGLPQRYLQDMQAEGIVTTVFNTTRGNANRFQLNFRNHRKIVVIDGQTAFVGGHNVGDEYVSRHPAFGAWRDTHVKVQGPVVKAIQLSFIQDWYWATKNIPDLNWDLNKIKQGSEETLMIASGPADALETCGLSGDWVGPR